MDVFRSVIPGDEHGGLLLPLGWWIGFQIADYLLQLLQLWLLRVGLGSPSV
jgi:hypothetical protein